MSDTPRTDAAEFPVMTAFGNEHPMVVRSTLARELERENAELRALQTKLADSMLKRANEMAELKAENERLRAQIAEMEGDLPIDYAARIKPPSE